VRAVNLIPPEDRRGDRAPTRTGPLSYIVVAALGVALLAVTGVVMTQNKISDEKSTIASLRAQEADAKARGARLQAYADFAKLQESRSQTVASLATSRFDWDRVLRELALVIPGDVYLTNLTATVSPGAVVGSSAGATASAGSGGSMRTQVPGPALEISGCGDGQTAVAGFMGALKEVDGVTRVGLSDSAKASSDTSGGSTVPAGDSSCSGGNSTSFDVVAAFDSVQVDPTTQAPVPVAPATPASDSSGVADAQQQEAAGRQSIQQQSDKAHQAVSTLIPGAVSGK
jgi:Tfp pilus assembly protein PilN